MYYPQVFDDRLFAVVDSPHLHMESPEIPFFSIASPINLPGALLGKESMFRRISQHQ